eukprot:sb/3473767/
MPLPLFTSLLYTLYWGNAPLQSQKSSWSPSSRCNMGVLEDPEYKGRCSWMSSDFKCYGIIITSCLFFSLCSLFTDFIQDMPVNEILWWRFFITFILGVLYNQVTESPSAVLKVTRSLMLTALFGTITASCTVFALRLLKSQLELRA